MGSILKFKGGNLYAIPKPLVFISRLKGALIQLLFLQFRYFETVYKIYAKRLTLS